jgi:hypothetical protein
MNTQFWGPSGWKFLHSITAIYPESPNFIEKLLMRDFMQLVCDILPCKYCRASFTKYSQSLDITPYLESREMVMEWLYKMHNKVNAKLRRQGFCTKENPTLEHVIKIYQKGVEHILDMLEKNNSGSEECMQKVINYFCDLGYDFLGSIIFNYQGYSSNCHTSEEKTKIVATYHKFFNIIQPMICQYICKLNGKLNNRGKDISDSYKIKKFKIRHILQQNEPYSKIKKWFYECNILCSGKQITTIQEYENHFNKHIVSFCNNPKAYTIKSCRKTKMKKSKHTMKMKQHTK